tara:strand:- start:84 stop:389 length:306 start_codon:yes stop_codon:yes gene_type:complete
MINMFIKFFKVKDLKQLTIVFIVFSITGSLSVYLGKPILEFLFESNTEKNLFYWFLRFLIIFPLYQILLIIIGTLFGQFNYFWRIEKKILSRLGIIKSSSS